MNPYNGFPGRQRLRALAWANAQYAAGTRSRATVCDACGQTEGQLDRHSEDYSEPFGPHIGAYGLCYTCHMMVHCRFKAPDLWQLYRAAVSAGATFPAVRTRNFWVIKHRYLVPGNMPKPVWRDAAPTRLVLDEIDAGVKPLAAAAAD